MIRRLALIAILASTGFALVGCGSEPRPGVSADEYRASQQRAHSQSVPATQTLPKE
jgi:hypothetical protein